MATVIDFPQKSRSKQIERDTDPARGIGSGIVAALLIYLIVFLMVRGIQ